jgi:hypothetical protein
MQARMAPNDFVTYSRRTLGSEIVRPLFQRGGGASYSNAFPKGVKRSLSPERPHAPSATRSVLPSIATSTFLSTSQPSASDEYASERPRGSFISSRYSARQDHTSLTS